MLFKVFDDIVVILKYIAGRGEWDLKERTGHTPYCGKTFKPYLNWLRDENDYDSVSWT